MLSDDPMILSGQRAPARRRRLGRDVLGQMHGEGKEDGGNDQGRPGEVLYYCHPCGVSFYAPSRESEGDDAAREESARLENSAAASAVEESKIEDLSATASEAKVGEDDHDSNMPAPGFSDRGRPVTPPTPGRTHAASSSPGSADRLTASTSPPSSSSSVRCPTCGDTFVELARMPHLEPRRRRSALMRYQQRQAQRTEAMHVQALLSALRASIVNQLEEAELRIAMRESMENYKPTMNPACKQSIADLEEARIVEAEGAAAALSEGGGAPAKAKEGASKGAKDNNEIASTITLNQMDESTCPICTEDYVIGETVIKALPQCKHGFHSGCIKKWFNVNDTCPICRAVLPAKCVPCEENQKIARDALEAQEQRRSSRTSDGGSDGASSGSNGSASESSSEPVPSTSDLPTSEASAVANAVVTQAMALATSAVPSPRSAGVAHA
eukprot:g1323.t1